MTDHAGRLGDNHVLSPGQIEQFHRDGYITLRGEMTEGELAAIEPEFDSFNRGEVPGMERDFCDMSGAYGRRFEEFSLVNTVLPRRYRPQIRDNMFERRSASFARQLIGGLGDARL